MRLSNECCSILRTLLLSFCLLTISLSAFGFNSNDDNDYVTVFKAGDEVCTPITIKTPYGTYTLISELRIPKSLSWWEAFDCQNRKLMHGESTVSVGTGQTTVRTYVLSTLFPSTSNENESDDNGSEYDTDSSYDSSSDYDTDDSETQSMNNKHKPLIDPSTMPSNNKYSEHTVSLINKVTEGVGMMDWSGMHLGISVGASRMFGEFAELRLMTSDDYAFSAYGGVGKDWLFKGRNSDKMNWFVGFGFMYGENEEPSQMTFGLSFSDNAIRSGYSLNFDFDYRYYFDANYRFGFFGGLSLGVGNFKEVVTYDEETEPFPGKFVWDVRVGLTVRI